MKREIIFSKNEIKPIIAISLGTSYKQNKKTGNVELVNIIYNLKTNKLGYNHNVHLPRKEKYILNNLAYDFDTIEILEDIFGICHISKWNEFAKNSDNLRKAINMNCHQLSYMVKNGESIKKEEKTKVRKYTTIKEYV